MVKDKRYKVLKTLFEGNNVPSFEYMLEIVPLSTIRQDLKTNYSSLKKKMEHPELFSLKELFHIADLIECNSDLLVQLATKEYSKRKRNKK